MSTRPQLLLLFAAPFFLSLPYPATGTGRTAVYPGAPGAEVASNILFETAFPLNELLPSRWTESQQREVAYLLERMKKDDRIFLLVQIASDPIGAKEEGERLAMDLSQAVAERLRESGIPPDRMLVVPGSRDARLFGERRWGAFEKFQKVAIRGLRGGDWLRRRDTPVAVREELPPEGTITILEPSEESTDRSNHLLRGTTAEGVRTVAIVAGRETRTAAVYGGRFEVPVSLSPGENRILVTGLDPFGRAIRAERTVRYVPPRPGIEIVSPAENAVSDISRSPIVTVKGTIRSTTPLRSAYLIQNDTPRRIRIRPDGSFAEPAALVTDEDRFSVEALDTNGQAGISEARTVASRGIAERPLLAVLHWDEDDVDLDLHVTDSRGRHTYFDAPDVMESATAVPSGKLWVDNRVGFGPEIFSVENDANETFTFTVQYYRGHTPCRAYLTVVLFAGSPSRRMTRLFGPITLSPRKPSARVVHVSLPRGLVRDLVEEDRKENR